MIVTKTNKMRFDFRHLEHAVDEVSHGECKFIFLTLVQCGDRYVIKAQK